MTNHKEVDLGDSKSQVMFQVGLQVALGDSFDRTLSKIKRHIEYNHMIEPDSLIFNRLVTQHMAAVIRIPSNHSLDDARLPNVLRLPPLVYDKGLPDGAE